MAGRQYNEHIRARVCWERHRAASGLCSPRWCGDHRDRRDNCSGGGAGCEPFAGACFAGLLVFGEASCCSMLARRIRSFFGLSPVAPGDGGIGSHRCCRVAGAASDVCWRAAVGWRRCCFSPGSTGSSDAPWPSASFARAWHSRRRLWPALCCSTCRRRLCRSW